MKFLSALDALFLHLETAEQPMHVGGLNTLHLPSGYRGDFHQDVFAHFKARLHLAPLFRRKLATMPLGVANPAWMIDRNMDLSWHIQRVKLAKPGKTKQLNAFVAKVHGELLPRDRPLWRAYVIEGLADGQVGFYAKFHHAALDGQGGVALAKAILDLEAHPSPRPTPKIGQSTLKAGSSMAKEPKPVGRPSTGAMLAASFRGLLGQYAALVRAAPQIGASVSDMVAQRMRGDLKSTDPQTVASVLDGFITGLRGGYMGAVKGLVGPKTRINVAISDKRAFATLDLPLQEVKNLGKIAGGSLNDIVLALVSGGLRRFLEAHNELPKKSLVCAMPVSLRSEPHQDAAEIENQSSMVLTTLASDVADPRERLRLVIEGTQRAKQVSAAMKTGMPTDIPSLGLPWLMTGLTKIYTGSKIANRLPPVANVVVSNVPGPPIALFMAGAQLSSYYPVSIVVHGIALNITLQSYHGRLYFGLIACAKAVPDVAKLATFLEDAFKELTVHLVQDQHEAAPAFKLKKIQPVKPESRRPALNALNARKARPSHG
jgi:diacylglycerol O-acyltransferase / wax synthase